MSGEKEKEKSEGRCPKNTFIVKEEEKGRRTGTVQSKKKKGGCPPYSLGYAKKEQPGTKEEERGACCNSFYNEVWG